MSHYRWENRQTNRYYRVLLAQDLLGHWVITRVWGNINQPSGRMSHMACTSKDEAVKLVDKIAKIRTTRGYVACGYL